MKNLAQIETTLNRLAGQAEAYAAQWTDFDNAFLLAETEAEQLATVLTILQTMEEAWRERFQQGLATIVSRGLTAVFDEEINVRLDTATVRDATSITIKVEQGGFETDVMDAKGGSLVQILAFLLTVLLVVSAQPSMRRALVLDEPFSMVSEDYMPRLCELITELNAQLGMQFIMTTHNMGLLACAQRAYAVYLEDGAARLRELT